MLSNDYIVGLTDGEGSFQVQIRKERKNPTIRFTIKLIEKDKEILDMVKSFFGCGNIYIQNDKRPNHSRCFRYEVSKTSDMMDIIIPFFIKNPPKLKSKINDFDLLKKIAEELKKNYPDYNLIKTLSKHMH
jgi:hypothetical protein